MFVVDVGSGIVFIHLLLSIHRRQGTLLDAVKTVMKDKVSTFKQLPIL